MSKAEYAVYQGDELLALGTDEQCSKLLDILPQSVRIKAGLYRWQEIKVED